MADSAVTQPEKRCTKCSELKPATTEFFSPIKSRCTLNSWCKPCMATWRRADRAENPGRYRRIRERYRDKDIETVRAQSRRGYWANIEARRERNRARQKERRDQYNANRRARLAGDAALRAKKSAQYRAWWEANYAENCETRRKAWAAKSSAARLRSYIGAAVSRCLRGRGKGGKSWVNLVGYTAPDLRAHLERQFVGAMSWSNYGSWHVDHIVPLAKFDIQGPDCPELRAAWALSNLRPLWAKRNMRKHARREHLL